MSHSSRSLDPDSRFRFLIEASEKPVEHVQKLPLHRYMKSGKEVLRMARIHEVDGDEEQAFMLYHRAACLLINKMRDLPDYKDASKEDKDFIRHTAKEILPKLENFKSSIKSRYTREYKDEQAALEAQMKKRHQDLEDAKRANLNSFTESFDNKNLDQRRFKEAQERILRQQREHCEQKVSTTPTAPSLISQSQLTVNLHSNFIDTPPSVALFSEPTITPAVDRTCKPKPMIDEIDESSGRSVVLPDSVIIQFISVAEANTRVNKETCGILMGRQIKGQLVITHLIIPKQKGTSDSCEMLSEEELIPIADSLTIFTLGWIHTHPTQTAFMSSIDLHTQFNFQSTSLESIGVVCAPKFDSVGTFSLTDFGLCFIGDCRERGHHLHPNDKLLYETSRHVIKDSDRNVQLVDLRFQ